MTIALTLVMTLLFFCLGLFAGNDWMMEEVSGGKDIVVFSITKGVEFGMWITVIITGVRMMLAEIIPAFHGIAGKFIPNAKPGLDIPLLFPNYPTSVIVGFLCSLVSGQCSRRNAWGDYWFSDQWLFAHIWTSSVAAFGCKLCTNYENS